MSKQQSLGIHKNGWSYNLQTGRFGTDYLLRAAIYKSFPFVTCPEEALYPMAHTDKQGQILNGSCRYVLKFKQTPSVKGFWSITVYEKNGFLVKNSFQRYAIGDRSKYLEYEEDGSLEIYLQQEPPENKQFNWLPVPPREFYLVLRAFYPESELLDGTYTLPTIERIA